MDKLLTLKIDVWLTTCKFWKEKDTMRQEVERYGATLGSESGSAKRLVALLWGGGIGNSFAASLRLSR